MSKIIGFTHLDQPVSLEVMDGSLKRVVLTTGGFSACLSYVSGDLRNAAEVALESESIVPQVGETVEWADRGFVGFGYRGAVISKTLVPGDVAYTVEVTDVMNSEGVVVPVTGGVTMIIGYSDLFLHKQSGVKLFPELEEVEEEEVIKPVLDQKKDKKKPAPAPAPTPEPEAPSAE